MKQTVPNTAPAHNTAGVVLECDLPDAREKVWRALTERDLLGAWLMPNDIRPEVGARFQLQATAAPAGEGAAVECAPVKCEVLEAEPGRKLRWRQQEPVDAVSPRLFVESVVTFELSDLPGGGTHLRVVHDGFTSGVTRCIGGAPQPQAGATVLRFRPRGLGVSRINNGPAVVYSLFIGLRRAA
jgi:uncharacterized protein YndB with AHSA1/START domain